VIVTFAIPWAILALLFSGGASWAWALLAGVCAARVSVALAVGWSILRDSAVLRYLWLLPVRDCIGLMIWVGSYTGHTVAWRGDRFVLKDGKLRSA
jgi:ceramide glucosyltransferase